LLTQKNKIDAENPFRSDVEVVDVITFLRAYLKREPGKEQAKAYKAIWGESIGTTPKWDKRFQEILLYVGMKGGKNYWAEGDLAYTCYYISCLKDPHTYFTNLCGVSVPYTEDKNFDIVNVSSVDADQAKRAFFDSCKNVLKLTKDPKTGRNWFEQYVGLDLRESSGAFKGNEIIFPITKPGKGTIRIMSFNSTAKAPEGLHIIRFYADELSRAETKAKYKVASALYDLGLNNTSVSFPNRVGKVVGWSYANDTDFDLTEERYKKSFEMDSIYAVRLATWLFNPSRTREMLEDQYKADPAKAKRVFECIKPISVENFYMPYVEKIREAIDPQIQNKIDYKLTHNRRGKGTYTGVEILQLQKDNKVRCFAIDPSKTKDRFVIAGGYLETINPLKLDIFIGDQLEVIYTNKKPIIDILIVIEPKEGFPVDYLAVADVISAIIQAYPNTRSINSDHFQNEKLRQEIESKGIESNTYFFSNQRQVRIYKKLRANIWNSNIAICKDLSKNHNLKIGANELTTTELWIYEGEKLIGGETKIDHPKDSSKDIQDVVAIVNDDLMELEAKGNETTSIETLSEAKLRDLAIRFMDEKHVLIQANLDSATIETNLKIRFGLKENEFIKLAKYVKDNYNY